jgi:hypothetical protein
MELKSKQEVFVAAAMAMIVADDAYTGGEAMEVWHGVEDMPLFAGVDFLSMQNDVLARFDKSQLNEAFSDDELAVIFTAADEMLSPAEQESLYEMLTKLSHADEAGHEPEKALLAKFKENLRF